MTHEALKPLMSDASNADFAAQLSKFADAQEQMAAQAGEDSWHWHHRALADLLREAARRALSAPPPAVAPQGWQDISTAPEIVKDVAALIKVELGSARTRTVFSDEGIYLVHFDNSTRQPNYWCGPITYAPTAPEKSNG